MCVLTFFLELSHPNKVNSIIIASFEVKSHLVHDDRLVGLAVELLQVKEFHTLDIV